jgi:hypothetical protein
MDKELDEGRKSLKAEVSEHDILCDAIRVICDDLEVAQMEGTSSLAARVIDVAEPPKNYGPHVLVIVLKTSNHCTRV